MLTIDLIHWLKLRACLGVEFKMIKIVFCLFILFCGISFAQNDGINFISSNNPIESNDFLSGNDKSIYVIPSKHGKNIAKDFLYIPYVQIGGTRFFNVKNIDSSAAVFDFFVPLWQSPQQLVFTDIRFYDRSGKTFEGNMHLGYRHMLSKEQILYGVYGAFDRKRSDLGHYFNQLTIGGELWLDKVFIGANFYQPIGEKAKLISKAESAEAIPINSTYKAIWSTEDVREEKAMRGADAEIGYEIINGLTSYLGGYCFKEEGIHSVCGPWLKLSYDFSLKNGKKILGVFDKLGFEAGIQRDKPRGTVTYLSANFRIGLLSNQNSRLQGVARHMIDLIHRDVDIVSIDSKKKERRPYVENGKIVKIREVSNKREFLDSFTDLEADITSVKGDIEDITEQELENSLKNREKENKLVFGNVISIKSNVRIPLVVDISSSSKNPGSITRDTANKLVSVGAKNTKIKYDMADLQQAIIKKERDLKSYKLQEQNLVVPKLYVDVDVDPVIERVYKECTTVPVKSQQESTVQLTTPKPYVEVDVEPVGGKVYEEYPTVAVKPHQEFAGEPVASKPYVKFDVEPVIEKVYEEYPVAAVKPHQEFATEPAVSKPHIRFAVEPVAEKVYEEYSTAAIKPPQEFGLKIVKSKPYVEFNVEPVVDKVYKEYPTAAVKSWQALQVESVERKSYQKYEVTVQRPYSEFKTEVFDIDNVVNSYVKAKDFTAAERLLKEFKLVLTPEARNTAQLISQYKKLRNQISVEKLDQWTSLGLSPQEIKDKKSADNILTNLGVQKSGLGYYNHKDIMFSIAPKKFNEYLTATVKPWQELMVESTYKPYVEFAVESVTEKVYKNYPTVAVKSQQESTVQLATPKPYVEVDVEPVAEKVYEEYPTVVVKPYQEFVRWPIASKPYVKFDVEPVGEKLYKEYLTIAVKPWQKSQLVEHKPYEKYEVVAQKPYGGFKAEDIDSVVDKYIKAKNFIKAKELLEDFAQVLTPNAKEIDKLISQYQEIRNRVTVAKLDQWTDQGLLPQEAQDKASANNILAKLSLQKSTFGYYVHGDIMLNTKAHVAVSKEAQALIKGGKLQEAKTQLQKDSNITMKGPAKDMHDLIVEYQAVVWKYRGGASSIPQFKQDSQRGIYFVGDIEKNNYYAKNGKDTLDPILDKLGVAKNDCRTAYFFNCYYDYVNIR